MNAKFSKSNKIFQHPQFTKTLIRAIRTIPAEEDMLIVKSSFILTSMGKKQKIKLTEMDLRATLEWLLNAIRINLCVGLCDILRAVEVLIKSIDNDISQVRIKCNLCNFELIKIISRSPTTWFQAIVVF